VSSPRTARQVTPGSTIVLYVGGSGRSGSTLLERLLGELDGVVTLGEVGHLWERGLVKDELCACGRPFSQCPFWTDVGARAFGGWEHVDAERVLFLKDGVDRQRRMPRTAARRPAEDLRGPLLEYSEYYRKVYDAAAQVAGARVVVDSSKVAPTALALSHHPDIDLRVLHISRDSRGVAYSWAKSVARPETSGTELMPQLTPLASSVLWSSHNAAIQLLRYRGVPVVRVKYEDLVVDPGPVVASAYRRLHLPGSGELPLVDRTSLVLGQTHSVAGNPMRFATGRTDLRPDTEWQSKMTARDRRIVTAARPPVPAWLGYVKPRRR